MQRAAARSSPCARGTSLDKLARASLYLKATFPVHSQSDQSMILAGFAYAILVRDKGLGVSSVKMLQRLRVLAQCYRSPLYC
jgi:hypothetical protein